MVLQSVRALCKAPGGAGSISKYLDELVRATGVSGRFACSFRTDLHLADEMKARKEVAMMAMKHRTKRQTRQCMDLETHCTISTATSYCIKHLPPTNDVLDVTPADTSPKFYTEANSA